jgi:hypothetical protein
MVLLWWVVIDQEQDAGGFLFVGKETCGGIGAEGREDIGGGSFMGACSIFDNVAEPISNRQ